MASKRIAVISFHTCPLAAQEGKETGGMNIYVLELSKALSKIGFIVDIFTRAQDETSPRIVNITSRLRVIHLEAGPPATVSKKKLINYTAEFVTKMISFVTKEKISYDLIHCHYYLSGIIGLNYKRKHNIDLPLVMTFHTLGLMKNLVARTVQEKETKKRIATEFQLTKKADKIISLSENDRDYLIHFYNAQGNKIVVINPGVDANLFKPMDKAATKKFIGAEPKEKIILFVGRIEPLKGIDVLMYAIKILLNEYPDCNISLLVVGGEREKVGSSELKRLEELKKMLDIESSVRFIEQKPQTELPSYYNAAEVLVMPSHYESFGITALEALACGVPVITTNTSGISSIIDKKYKHFVTSANNPLLLASQIEELIMNEEKHEKLIEEMMKEVRNLSWDKVAQKVAYVYNQLL